LKNTDKQEIITAIKQVSAGKNFFSADVTTELMKGMNQVDDSPRLTNREIEIICLIEKELSNKQIADKLFISERTVETHRKNIFRKTATQSIVGLIKYAYDHKLI
ncbi:MAG: response regulator transcription factor, partial [Pyrinomonadaceae bacterium]|nr:response regulator transcription factor [Sphingobacteriaceae bacterium]